MGLHVIAEVWNLIERYSALAFRSHFLNIIMHRARIYG